MDKILYIHVGTPKTGTSAIQQFCASNKEAFEKRKYCYPILPYRYKNKAVVRNGHFLTGPIEENDGKRNKEEERRRFLGGMEIIKNLFQSYQAVVLSDETLWRSTTLWRPELWEELNQIGQEAGFKVVIIAYLRRQDEYLTSLWSQDVKEGYLPWASVRTWEVWYEEKEADKIIDYKAKMDEYVNAVGKENVVLRKYDRKEFIGGSIYSDFLQAIGLEMEEDFFIPENEKNLGLKGNTNEIRRIINTVPGISGSDHMFFRNALLEFSGISAQNYPSSVMSGEEKKELLTRCQQGNKEVARFIYGEDRDLFEGDDRDLPKWEKDNPYMIDDVIRLVTMTTIQLREENRELQKRIKQLESDLRNPILYYPKKLRRKIMRTVEKQDNHKNKSK